MPCSARALAQRALRPRAARPDPSKAGQRAAGALRWASGDAPQGQQRWQACAQRGRVRCCGTQRARQRARRRWADLGDPPVVRRSAARPRERGRAAPARLCAPEDAAPATPVERGALAQRLGFRPHAPRRTSARRTGRWRGVARAADTSAETQGSLLVAPLLRRALRRVRVAECWSATELVWTERAGERGAQRAGRARSAGPRAEARPQGWGCRGPPVSRARAPRGSRLTQPARALLRHARRPGAAWAAGPPWLPAKPGESS